MPYRAKILLIEDDQSLGSSLKEELERENFSVHWATNTTLAKKMFFEKKPDLLLIDLRLPDGNGLHLPKELELRDRKIPFLFLTAQASAENRLAGFELGAEECIPKPFHLRELLLRLEKTLQTLPAMRFSERWILEGKEIHLDSYKILSSEGQSFSLTKREGDLLLLLLQSRDRVLSRTEILEQLFPGENRPTERTIDNSVVKLRALLGEESIRNLRGVGYQFVGEVHPLEKN